MKTRKLALAGASLRKSSGFNRRPEATPSPIAMQARTCCTVRAEQLVKQVLTANGLAEILNDGRQP